MSFSTTRDLVEQDIARLKTVPAAALIAVSKNQPDELIDAALQAGQRVFGENRVQEAQRHWQHRRALYPDLQLHLIGPLQSNKAADAVALFDVIHTIDRPKIATVLDAEMQRQQRFLPCFIQVNVGEEPQKSGIAPTELADFIAFCRTETQLNIIGLMCIPPADTAPDPYFSRMQSWARQYALPHLSMGMSDDYRIALQHGATHIRIGSRLFGART